jgi:hypothetical protein
MPLYLCSPKIVNSKHPFAPVLEVQGNSLTGQVIRALKAAGMKARV